MQQQHDEPRDEQQLTDEELLNRGTSATYKQRMFDLALALNARLEERAKSSYFTNKQYRKRKTKNKFAKQTRKKNRR